MSTSSRRKIVSWSVVGIIVATALAAPQAALAKKSNVSDLVSGGQPIPYPKHHIAGKKVDCGSRCAYTILSSGRMDNSSAPTAGTVSVSSWPPSAATVASAPPEISKKGVVPQPFDDEDGHHQYEGGNVREEAGVDFQGGLFQSRQVRSESFASGSGTAVLTYNVRINTGSEDRYWYVDFKPPKVLRAVTNAFMTGGPSGEEPLEELPDSSAARSTMDVYVDGLPVWSGEASEHRLTEFSAEFIRPPFQFAWGEPLNGKGKRTLFLGLVSSDTTMNVTFVFRVDERVEAPNCLIDYEAFPQPLFTHRCHAQAEALLLPYKTLRSRGTSPFIRLDLQVYSR